MKIPKDNPGFTLIETMLYSLILGVVLTSFVYFAIAVSGNKEKNSAVLAVNADVRGALDVIGRELRQANSLISAEDGALAFYGQDNKVMNLDLEDGRLRLNSDGNSYFLTGREIVIDDLVFGIMGKNGKSVKISFRAGTAGDSRDSVYSRDIQTAASLRN